MKKKSCLLQQLERVKFLIIVVLFFAAKTISYAQNSILVSGEVFDESTKETIPGVTVRLKDSSIGTSTDINGRFSLNITDGKGQVLVFSYVGYYPREVMINNESQISVGLKMNLEELEEVVVVGYGTQKKINLTGAVDQIGEEAFENRPMPNATRGLQGVIPNLNIEMGDGKPTRTSSFNVRGGTSIGSGGSALVLIDGVPGDPSLLNPNDIESVTVLKDAASAAIYGARGSFGVVLFTTKKAGKTKSQVNFSSNISLNDRTIKPDLVTDGYTWAKLFDHAYYSWNDYKTHPSKVNSVFPFSLDYLDELKKRHEDPKLPMVEVNPATGNYVYYGSTDWMKELYADRMASREYNLSVSGSGERSDFYVSGRFNSQDGIFRYNPDDYSIYNLRAKGGVYITDWLKVNNNFEYSDMEYFYPILNHPSNTPVFRRVSDEAFPIAMLTNPDGSITQNGALVFGSFISGGNYRDQNRSRLQNTIDFSAKLLDDRLSVNGNYTFNKIYDNTVWQYTPVPYSISPSESRERGENKLIEEDNTTSYKGFNLFASYEERLKAHFFKGMIGYNYEMSSLKRHYLERDNLINPQLPDFTLATGQNILLKGGGSEWAILGTFFRFNYSYDDKYLIEVNGRYDGSSKFPKNQQWGFFPSASLGWRVSGEDFWESLSETIPQFKLRGSYGSLGNGNISPYQYLGTMSVGLLGRYINGSNPLYTSNPKVVPNGLTWETATTLNLGTDVGMFGDQLTATFDWYIRNTTDMFTKSTPLPSVFGASEPKGNFADLQTKGWELSLSWRDQISWDKPLTYSLRMTISDNITKVTKYNNPEKVLSDYYEGQILGEIWGFVNDGYFTDQKDIEDHADQSYIRVSAANNPMPGDIKFKDLNGDGIILPGSNTVDDPGDRRVIGNSTPRYQFGFLSNMEWNNFSLSLFFQGVGKREFWPGTDNSLFWGAYNRPYSWHPAEMESMMWSENNPDSYFPRLRGYVALNSRGELRVEQSKYIQNAAYVRLKNLTIGYDLPSAIINSIKGLSKARVYFNGQNLWTYSPMFKIMKTMDPEVIEGSDPELASNRGNGMRYPMLKTYTLGINVTF
ncbi:SusC/RagA family TonB-linked outer membrane protein [Echinicola sediminis]